MAAARPEAGPTPWTSSPPRPFPTWPRPGSCSPSSEAVGYDGAFTYETRHDPFLPLALAADRTSSAPAGHRGRHRLRPHPDAAGHPSPTTSRTLSAGRVRRSGSAPRSGPTSNDASPCPGRARPPGSARWSLAIRAIWDCLGRDRPARLPRRVLHAHADAAGLRSRARPRSAGPAIQLGGVGPP